jgi:hypothetical protein
MVNAGTSIRIAGPLLVCAGAVLDGGSLCDVGADTASSVRFAQRNFRLSEYALECALTTTRHR